MLEFLILAGVAVWLVFALRSTVRHKGGCGGDCAHCCGSCTHCADSPAGKSRPC